MPWRFTTPTPSPGTTTTVDSNLDEILQAIDTSAYQINNGSLSLNDTEVVVAENGSESFRIIDDEHVILPLDTALPSITTGANTVGDLGNYS